jgi:hypothetical protein
MKNNELARGVAAFALVMAGGVLLPANAAEVTFDDQGHMLILGTAAGPGTEDCCDDPGTPPNTNCPCGL